jgi:hypothetical protein
MNPHLRLVLVAVVLVSAASGQVTLGVPATPVAAGVPFPVVLTNNSTNCIDLLVSNVLTLLTSGGDLITPEVIGCGPVSICLLGGQSASLGYTMPATGPGSIGSFLLLCPYEGGAVARVDVGTPDPAFPDIHSFPSALPLGPGGHQVAPAGTNSADWTFANTASVGRTVSMVLSVFPPGGTTPVGTTLLASLPIPAGGIIQVPLPLQGVNPGPYTVEAAWTDPGTGTSQTVRHGIQVSSGVMVDLHLPGGKVIPFGGSITARLIVSQVGSLTSGPPWNYALAVGIQPGGTLLSGGVIVPLVLDPLVVASLSNGLGGLLVGNVGLTASVGAYCAHGFSTYPGASGITLAHPNVPALSGFTLRVAAVVGEPMTGVVAASQPEEIILQ